MRHATLPSIRAPPRPEGSQSRMPSLVVAPPATGAGRAGASPTTRSLLCHSTLAAGAP
jgi:hypothetical protein